MMCLRNGTSARRASSSAWAPVRRLAEDVVTSWLERSGQRWKTRNPSLATAAIVVLVFLAAVLNSGGSVPRWSVLVMLALAALGRIAGLVLPLLVQCRVCGVQLGTCSVARSTPWHARSDWLAALQACPVCGDDGRATLEAVRAWQASGRVAEHPYWSGRRMLLAILAAILVVSIGVVVGTGVSL